MPSLPGRETLQAVGNDDNEMKFGEIARPPDKYYGSYRLPVAQQSNM